MRIEDFKEKYNYPAATPVMRQYLDIKFSNIECLLLFRMGDFYELFYEDAITASRTLGIALTKRGKSGERAIEMCGVPHHALENYLNKLLEEGFKVAICDQMETPEEAKKRGGYKAIVNRSITRIITQGTILEESLLDAKEPNYLVSIAIDKKGNAGISSVDLSTSEISVISVPEREIINELARIRPKEILLSEQYRSGELASVIGTQLDMRISFQVDSFFSAKKCEKNILDFYQISDLAAIGQLTMEQISAVGSIIEYISLTQKANLPKLPKPKILNYNKFMSIDASTRRNLEINAVLSGGVRGSLLSCIDNSVTKTGSRLLNSYLSAPLIEIDAINKRLSVTKFFYDDIPLTEIIRKSLKQTGDLERCLTRLNMGRGTPKDLLSIKYTIEIAEQIQAEFVAKKGVTLPENIEKITQPLLGMSSLHDLIAESIREDAPNIISNGGIINRNYHPKVAELHDLIENGQDAVEKLRDKYRQETGIDTLKINNNNVIGLFIDITARHADKILGENFIHRQTTANSIRYTTKELQELESNMVNAKLLVVSLEQEIYAKICMELVDNQQLLLALAGSISLLDVYCNFAIIAHENNYCAPELSDDMRFEIKAGRHPVIENILKKSAESFMHNDSHLSMDERVWLITGPNMSGKSTYLRQNALITILAQIGSYVPASSAKIGVVDKIFSRIGAGDDLNKGQSTFMLEMLETSAILAQATHKSLIILDEVGRGTSTYDGVAIAWSVLEHIHDKLRARCMFATHYHELVAMEDILPALANYTVAIDDSDGRILFLHKIKKGSADKSYGVHVAELAGLPKSVIRKATDLLKKFEKDSVKSSKELMRGESYNMNLFDMASENAPPSKYQELAEELSTLNPDKLSPREALDILYKLKETANSA
ncbi:MAG: DNA mismatch repair protein MutS [Rickettsiales bacterium]|nr:MAG: DNA mismatch repair protein MutS [Rickettsiales bacterium]